MAEWTTTYDDMVSQLETFVEDLSAEFVATVNGCINRAEERLFKDLDLSLMNLQLPTTLGSGIWSLSKTAPIKQSPLLNIFNFDTSTHIERRTLAYVQAYGATQGPPAYFAEDTVNVYFAPVPDMAYNVVITYPNRPTPLASGNQTNWFTDNSADLLLYAALVESETFLIAPERVQEFEGKYRVNLGPARAFWRGVAQTGYEPINPTPTPQATR
jgi:hypothetical protein